jgi:hypothetical protein
VDCPRELWIVGLLVLSMSGGLKDGRGCFNFLLEAEDNKLDIGRFKHFGEAVNREPLGWFPRGVPN